MVTLTLKSYSGQLIFDPDSIVSSLILQSNIINLLYLIVQEKFSLFTHTDRLGAEGMQQVHPPPILKLLYLSSYIKSILIHVKIFLFLTAKICYICNKS